MTDNAGLSAKDTVQVIVNDPSQSNRPPVANAGSDQTITLPTNTVSLNGSVSTDPDNNITGYVWTKISGPSSFNIANTIATQAASTTLHLFQPNTNVALIKNNSIVFYAGYPQFDICDPDTDVWSIGVINQSNENASLISYNNIIYIAGGEINGIISNKLWKLEF